MIQMAMGSISLRRITRNTMKLASNFKGFPALLTTAAMLLSMGVLAHAQSDAAKPAAQPAPIATEDLRPVADRLGQSLAAINVAKWKAPNEVKGQAQSDIASIQRNLRTTLPELLDQAKASPDSLAPAFAVYRNLSALYDVLLRVAETATLAGPPQDGSTLEDEIAHMEAARKSLGTAIFDTTSARDAELVRLRASAAQMAAQSPVAEAPAKKTIVNDGPPVTIKKRKKSAVVPAP